MADPDRVLDLLVEWEERRDRGEMPCLDELCAGEDESVRQALHARVQRRLKFDALLDPTVPGGAATANAPPPPQPAVPCVPGYEILDLIGSGGMGVVYRARQRHLRRLVALKVIRTGPLSSPGDLHRFRAEAEAVARLQHPGIVQIFEVGAEGQHQQPYLALEFVPGGSLAQHLRATPLPPRRMAELTLHLARAVQHAHDHGVIHRDLKPANILLTEQGAPKIADFGLAKQLDDDGGQTRTGAIMGTPNYMSPEQAEGRLAEVGPASDIYSLGAILYEMLTGRPPFTGTTLLETLEYVRTQEPVAPRALQPGVPRDLEVVCLKCLQKRPRERYASAKELADDLERFLAGEPILAKPPTLIEGAMRNLRRTKVHPAFMAFGDRLLMVAPFPLVPHLIAYWLARGSEHYHLIMTLTSLGVILTAQAMVQVGQRRVMAQVPADQVRHFYTMWGGEVVGSVLVWLIVWSVTPVSHPEALFAVYPLWAIGVAQTYLAFASMAGGFYITGPVFFLFAMLLLFVLPWAPLAISLLMCCNITVHGLILRSDLLIARDGN